MRLLQQLRARLGACVDATIIVLCVAFLPPGRGDHESATEACRRQLRALHETFAGAVSVDGVRRRLLVEAGFEHVALVLEHLERWEFSCVLAEVKHPPPFQHLFLT